MQSKVLSAASFDMINPICPSYLPSSRHSFTIKDTRTARSLEKDVEVRKRKLKDEITNCMQLLDPEQINYKKAFQSQVPSLN